MKPEEIAKIIDSDNTFLSECEELVKKIIKQLEKDND